MACKQFLGLPRSTPNAIIYGELGRYPLYINSSIKSIKYWLNLLQMNDDRLPKQAYRMLVALDGKGKRCWVTNIKELLFKSGFGIAWHHQGVGNINHFINVFKRRLTDMYSQNWHELLDGSDRYESYRSYKKYFETEKYIDFFYISAMRKALSKFRSGMFPINACLYRFHPDNNQKLCPICISEIEDEFHILFVCPLYNSIRDRYITPNKHKFNLLKQPIFWTDIHCLSTLAVFLVNCIKIRDAFLSST